ncbi:hypothetical protein P7D22_04780 [Lichenihabitans sp. Uapishka_5]|uniref:hypothetical protein n=1 Tax=Lichenihabitans sp. Uapishka_5 TaxID=3037302 RepID=UPI0029E7D12E|nr:hypothetical protein [Lichenihabitans sp. Uapishka_5]MDX7950494.1 hypothetical protein [Lichenihabitans sp. Uapishka_5]
MSGASCILGVDIGRTGAVALLTAEGDLLDVADLPTLPDGPACRPSISAPLLAKIMRQWQPSSAYIEFVGPRPTDGSKAAFAFGAAKGTVESTLAVLGVGAAYLTPPQWKRIVGIPAGKGLKDLARAAAVRRWPRKADVFARAMDDGRAEAALIGLAGILRGRP